MLFFAELRAYFETNTIDFTSAEMQKEADKNCNKIINKEGNHCLKYLDNNKFKNKIQFSILITFLGKKITIKIFMLKFVNPLFKNVWRRGLMAPFLHMVRLHPGRLIL